jgi:hypothetical protein
LLALTKAQRHARDIAELTREVVAVDKGAAQQIDKLVLLFGKILKDAAMATG